MAKIEKTKTIRATVHEVFDYVTEPHNLPEIWPSLVAVENATVEDDGSVAFDWTYKMAGIHFHGRSETEIVDPYRRRVMSNKSGIPSTFDWRFEDLGDKCTVTLLVDYQIPGKVLDKLAEPFIHRANERELETVLENLKERVESEKTAGARPTEVRP